MDDQDSGSSSGLVIGMIVGGVVVLTLIVLVVLGGAVFWTFEARGPGGGPAAPAAVMVAEEAVQAADPPLPAVQVEKPREHLIGVWESKSKDGGVALMDFRGDGTLVLTDKVPGKTDLVQPAIRWDVRADKDFFKIKLDTVQGEPMDHVVRFLDNDRLLMETMEGRVYERQKKAQ